MNEWAQLAVTLLIGAGTVAGSWAAVKVSRRNAQTSETVGVTEAALMLVDPLKQEIEDLRERVEHLEIENKRGEQERQQLHRWALALTGQLHGAGIDPISFEQIRYLDGNGGLTGRK